MANYTTINKSSEHFNTKLYTGNGSTQSITGVGFQPDWVWIKARSATRDHNLYDVVRGANKRLDSHQTLAEETHTTGLTSFDSNGFSLGNLVKSNNNNETYASWNWLANGAGSANTDGSISSTVSANTTAGFSIVKWSGSGANATIGHGLGSTPKMVITKSLGTSAWGVYNENLGNTNVMFLDTAAATSSNIAYWNNTSPTSTGFSVGTDDAVNHSGNEMIAYCFAEKKGYSKFGSYTGNGSGTDGTFVYTGFKPAFVMVKSTDISQSWQMSDNKRDTFNVVNNRLRPNESIAESTSPSWVDFNSQGFKFRHQDAAWNGSGNSYIYMAFAEAPLVGSNNVPCTAR